MLHAMPSLSLSIGSHCQVVSCWSVAFIFLVPNWGIWISRLKFVYTVGNTSDLLLFYSEVEPMVLASLAVFCGVLIRSYIVHLKLLS